MGPALVIPAVLVDGLVSVVSGMNLGAVTTGVFGVKLLIWFDGENTGGNCAAWILNGFCRLSCAGFV